LDKIVVACSETEKAFSIPFGKYSLERKFNRKRGESVDVIEWDH